MAPPRNAHTAKQGTVNTHEVYYVAGKQLRQHNSRQMHGCCTAVSQAARTLTCACHPSNAASHLASTLRWSGTAPLDPLAWAPAAARATMLPVVVVVVGVVGPAAVAVPAAVPPTAGAGLAALPELQLLVAATESPGWGWVWAWALSSSCSAVQAVEQCMSSRSQGRNRIVVLGCNTAELPTQVWGWWQHLQLS